MPESIKIEETSRYDIKGKSYIGTSLKYFLWIWDLEIRGLIIDKWENGKMVKKQLEVDFICNKGSKKYYIQSVYMLGTVEKWNKKFVNFQK